GVLTSYNKVPIMGIFYEIFWVLHLILQSVICKKLHTMMIVASIISIISSIVGLYFSYIYNIPSGATIVICAFIIYLVVFALHKLNLPMKKGSVS
ncbi:metal ABC transporter permease, partial [Staphylococcus pettenkoferi]|uniref:metal ABC transporter permease n=1 Tax=Staphylococcus pettenkoferi TaxID=170573 RepID=UPI001F250EDC